MLINRFQTHAHANCFLAGDYPVAKHCPVIVIPIAEKQISIVYTPSDDTLRAQCHSPYEATFLTFFWDTLRHGLRLLDLHKHNLHGTLELKNNIPMGSEIGFSSALCLVIARWFSSMALIKEKEVLKFAQKLEEAFHEKTNGVDIIGAMSEHLLHFERPSRYYTCGTRWLPHLYLSHVDSKDLAVISFDSLFQYRKQHIRWAHQLDNQMNECVSMIENALAIDQDEGIPLLANAMEQTERCFEQWGLVTPVLQKHIEQLHELGAIAAKPVGIGRGGYVISLWTQEPPSNCNFEIAAIKSL